MARSPNGEQPTAAAIEHLAAALGADTEQGWPDRKQLESLDVAQLKALMMVVSALLGPELNAR